MLPLFLIFIALPIAELWLLIEIGGVIGVPLTLAILVVDSLIGASVARSQSRAAWERFNLALAESRMPAREVFDGAMIILGGALLVTPGFITDIFGLACLLPPSRALIRRFVSGSVTGRAGMAWRMASYAPRAGARAREARRSAKTYDYEGSAREVTEPPEELDRPEPASDDTRG